MKSYWRIRLSKLYTSHITTLYNTLQQVHISTLYITLQQVPIISSDSLEEEFMVTRLFVSKAKSEIKTFMSRSILLERSNQEVERKLVTATGELSECRLELQQVSILYLYVFFFL